VHGDRDNFFPIEIAENLSLSIPGSELWVIRGGDHVPIYDPPIPFTEKVLQFLAS
jgi:pimeloyl-ACP methyl ester carboxylesterase